VPRRKEPRIPDAVLDQLLAGADPKTAFDPNGLIDDLKKALAERVLNPEMDHHLTGEEPGNRRNGYGKKTVITDTGQIELAVPRDREARFAPAAPAAPSPTSPPASKPWPRLMGEDEEGTLANAERLPMNPNNPVRVCAGTAALGKQPGRGSMGRGS
jgi:hypothetical protein